jgi:hypothetical protein
MKKLYKIFLLSFFGLLLALPAKAQQRPIDMLNTTDYFGITTMFYYNYRNWVTGDNATKGSLRFDSFRIWAKTDVDKRFFGAVQYRFYEGWNTPTHLYIGFNINKKNVLQLGHTWVPFGYGYQPFDDWGNITYYVGLQDDYDYGFTWSGTYGIFRVDAGFFKNQQLSSSSPFRYDADIFSGDVSSDYLIPMAKKNEEVNQFNGRFEVHPVGDNWDLKAGVSGMYGQLYNMTTDDNGDRLAAAVHFGLTMGNLHFNAQQTWYKYTQALPDSATLDMHNFINVSSWAFAYEIPSETNIFTTSAAYDIIGEKLTVHANYSYLWGGTAQTQSQLLTVGVRTIWDTFEVFAETRYGVNDPQLSGNASGYGRDAGSYDFRVDVRFFYKLKIVSKSSIEWLKKQLEKRDQKAVE